jgi:hypothetical protein
MPGPGFGGRGRGVPSFTGNSYAFQNAMSQLRPMRDVPRGGSGGVLGESFLGSLISRFRTTKLMVLSREAEDTFGARAKATGIALAKGSTNFAFEQDFLTKLTIAKEDLDKGKIDQATWARRIMKAAKAYYSYLKVICYYTEEDYKADMINFANQNGIDFEFDSPSKSR